MDISVSRKTRIHCQGDLNLRVKCAKNHTGVDCLSLTYFCLVYAFDVLPTTSIDYEQSVQILMLPREIFCHSMLPSSGISPTDSNSYLHGDRKQYFNLCSCSYVKRSSTNFAWDTDSKRISLSYCWNIVVLSIWIIYPLKTSEKHLVFW